MAATVETVVPGVVHPLIAAAGGPELVIYRTQAPMAGAYADVSNLDAISIGNNTRHDFSTADKALFLRIASRLLDSHIGQRWRVPLRTWSDAWVWAVCEVAHNMLFAKRGHDPAAPTERTVTGRGKVALDWVKMAQDYEVTIDPRLVLTEPGHVGRMFSDQPRGWSGYGRGARRGGGFFRG